MAKRKRLTPALFGGSEQALASPAETFRERPPIARVAGETATEAAFAEVAGVLAAAREEGRLIVKLPLDAIETGHLVRDRIAFDPEEMAALEASLRARGQQVPVEVVPLGGDDGVDGAGQGRYGLISGLRRVMALRAIGAGEALALVRRPESSADAYLAMVEENEIRSGISFYERARLASEAARLGLYPDTPAAIAALFSSASPAKRSKIGSFVRVHQALGHALRYPAAIPERLGLALAGLLDRDPGAAGRVAAALEAAAPTDAGAERAMLDAQLATVSAQADPRPGKRVTSPREIANGLRIEVRRGRVVLSGAAVTDALCRDLEAWLAGRG
ncbi:ParB N-terminal domain-containing protein [Roseibacterium sp. SDUM158017]|uniref:ParB/RepB/Spo0J family partition protein n=1 Tax=Roseicyclus salinarum TaxID=3036773 RepID=UPI00241565F9|nr:ParB N-terminal domain-containing protein [Roseibacterium sp. SDUM158017]MDG4649632.1 ParB N-terminal domain-containing protein [Roseibacterium sp. SDUM158017]